MSFKQKHSPGGVLQKTCWQMSHAENTFTLKHILPTGNYISKVNNKSTRTRCEICSKLTIKTPE